MEKEKQTSETITIKKDSLWKYATFALLGIVLVGAFFVLSGKTTGTGNVVANNPSAGNNLPVPTPQVVEVSVDDDAVLGDSNAPVTIIEFSDYQCPFCRKFWIDTLPSIKKDYIDTGKVKFVYRDFPLSFHPMAQSSAEAANCAREDGGDEGYYKMHDKIFQEQMVLDGGTVQSTVTYSESDLKAWAKEIDYDIDSCLDSGKYANEVQRDFTDGGNSGVQGTPGFFINGKPLSGAQPYSAFKQVIDAELAA